MNETPLYPLRFAPLFQYRLWGARRLGSRLSVALPGDDLIGEAWLLSDRDDHPSEVADGPLEGRTIGQLLARSPEQLLGKLSGHFSRFPVLLKFLDVKRRLSVQVHPSDAYRRLIPAGGRGALAGRGRSMFLPAARCRQLVGDFAAGSLMTP